MGVTGFVRNARRAVALQRAASRIMLAALGCRFVVRGAPPARGAGACVLVANHTSYLDIPLLLAALDCDFGLRHEARAPRVADHLAASRARARTSRSIATASSTRGAVVARIVKTLRAGRSVLLFPEGTFSFDDGLRPFHAGAFKSAVAAGVPVVPIALAGVAGVWSQHARFPRAGRVEIWVGEPLDAPVGDGDARVEALRSEAHRFIASHACRPA